MRLLLDTHALLWFLGGSERLSPRARNAVENADNTRLFSIAGAWEIAIKAGMGRRALAVPFQQLVPGEIQNNAIEILPILPEHSSRSLRCRATTATHSTA
ncbi:MAG TPA: type II toxin-antitoxin system VapC family toxin [Longimicrobiaceae bacterium]|nr:type II toxin-antitoxin system VapC family toxin [Longimicrobiaceae bacterium]